MQPFVFFFTRGDPPITGKTWFERRVVPVYKSWEWKAVCPALPQESTNVNWKLKSVERIFPSSNWAVLRKNPFFSMTYAGWKDLGASHVLVKKKTDLHNLYWGLIMKLQFQLHRHPEIHHTIVNYTKSSCSISSINTMPFPLNSEVNPSADKSDNSQKVINGM